MVLTAASEQDCDGDDANQMAIDWRWSDFDEVDIDQFPHTVYIDNSCNGALAVVRGLQIVLSSAACFEDPPVTASELTVWAGSSIKESGTPRSVRKLIKHPEYVYGKNDIAILILEKDYELSKDIKPVELPPPGHGLPEGLTVTGWFFWNSKMIGKWNPISYKCDFLDSLPFPRHWQQICTYTDNKSKFQGKLKDESAQMSFSQWTFLHCRKTRKLRYFTV